MSTATGDVSLQYLRPTQGLQCPLCTNADESKMLLGCYPENWGFTCDYCDCSIILPSELLENQVRFFLAYKLPPQGKEYEDYEHN